jgi:hypothetical protein
MIIIKNGGSIYQQMRYFVLCVTKRTQACTDVLRHRNLHCSSTKRQRMQTEQIQRFPSTTTSTAGRLVRRPKAWIGLLFRLRSSIGRQRSRKKTQQISNWLLLELIICDQVFQVHVQAYLRTRVATALCEETIRSITRCMTRSGRIVDGKMALYGWRVIHAITLTNYLHATTCNQ